MIKFINKYRFAKYEAEVIQLRKDITELRQELRKAQQDLNYTRNDVDALTRRNYGLDYGQHNVLNLHRLNGLLQSVLNFLDLEEVPPDETGWRAKKRIKRK